MHFIDRSKLMHIMQKSFMCIKFPILVMVVVIIMVVIIVNYKDDGIDSSGDAVRIDCS